MTRRKIDKLLLLGITLLITAQFSYGQITETSFNAYSGVFSFHGKGSTSNSWINFNPYVSPNKYTSNPYGKRSDFSYALELQKQRVTKTQNIYGLGISFEALTSKVNIDSITQNGFNYYQYSASGKTTLKNTFVAINPFIGHRYSFREINVDFLVGFDLAFSLKSKEVGKATANNKDYIEVDNNRAKPAVDFRPRIQINTQTDKFGILAGYSLGLTNYQIKNSPKAFTGFLRLGISYQIK